MYLTSLINIPSKSEIFSVRGYVIPKKKIFFEILKRYDNIGGC